MNVMPPKLIDCLDFCEPFWIARFGDWVYLFSGRSGALLGRPLFYPVKPTKGKRQNASRTSVTEWTSDHGGVGKV